MIRFIEPIGGRGATTLSDLEKFAEIYARDHQLLSELVAALQAEMAAVKARQLARLRTAVIFAQTSKAVLHTAVAESAALFERPRTQIFHGIKIGLAKGKGRLEISDEAATLAKIRQHFGREADRYLRTSITPNKEALAQLPAAELKKLGVTLTDSGDTVVIKPMNSEVEKTVASLLREDGPEGADLTATGRAEAPKTAEPPKKTSTNQPRTPNIQ